ncbi:hypothetical protein D3C87_1656760 [compost metagenome]
MVVKRRKQGFGRCPPDIIDNHLIAMRPRCGGESLCQCSPFQSKIDRSINVQRIQHALATTGCDNSSRPRLTCSRHCQLA